MSLLLTGAGRPGEDGSPAGIRFLRLPGTYRPQDDTYLLLRTVLGTCDRVAGARVLDICTGTGRLAVGLAMAGAGQVTAVDISLRATLTARVNSALHRQSVVVLRSDLLERVTDRQFDLILANPPYVPSRTPAPRKHGRARAWDAGRDGRRLLDRICADAPARLAPGGELWIVHSCVSDPARTVAMLADTGLDTEVVAHAAIPFGPVMRSRASWLSEHGLIHPGQQTERLVVVRGIRPATSADRARPCREQSDGGSANLTQGHVGAAFGPAGRW